MKLHITSQSFDSSTDVQNPSIKNLYVLQMNGNRTKKGWTVNVDQLSSHEDKLFSNWFASRVRAAEQNKETPNKVE